MGYMRTALLLATLTGLFLAVGYVIGGQTGVIFAFGLALVMNLFTYWNADKIVLRMYRAQPANGHPLEEIVADLARRADLPNPKVYIIDNDQPNAFATGRNPGAIPRTQRLPPRPAFCACSTAMRSRA